MLNKSGEANVGHCLLTQRRLQIVLGIIWLFDAGLQFQPYMFTREFVANFLAMNAMFQPRLLGNALEGISRFLLPHAAIWNFLFATTQLAIGVGLLFRRTVKPAILLSLLWVLGVWVVGEGFGGLFTPVMSSPLAGFPGPVLVYGIVGLILWPTERMTQGSVAAAGVLGARGARILWAVLWVGAAVEQLRPGFPPNIAMTIVVAMNEPGEPSWLLHLNRATTTFIKPVGSPLAFVLAVLEITIGMTVFRGRSVRAFLWLAIVLSIVFWVTAQDFGGVLAGNATDPGAGPLYILLALTLYPCCVGYAANTGAALSDISPRSRHKEAST